MTHYCPLCHEQLPADPQEPQEPHDCLFESVPPDVSETRFTVDWTEVAGFVLTGLSGAAFGLLVAQWLFGGL